MQQRDLPLLNRKRNQRSAYRVNVAIPSTVSPALDTEDKHKTIIKNLSATGCVFTTHDFEAVRDDAIVLCFSLDKSKLEIFSTVVRVSSVYDKDKKDIAVVFGYPYNVPDCIGNPLNWMENEISQYVMKEQRKALQDKR